MASSTAALRRTQAARNRLLAVQARHDTREWQVKRRERTRHLIELGGLVVKAGIVELVDDDRAVILGLLVEAAVRLRGDSREQVLTLWRRRGRRAFAEAADGKSE
ncbi:conjugal transfer protein TraD [Novosphingobium sp. ERN07]|nr:conjugal transfer protein TraD [Novosphingobium sp. ERN07]